MSTQIVVYKTRKRTPYWIEDKAAEPYLTFLRKVSRGVSIADAAEQTIGLSRAKQTISFHPYGKPHEKYHYSITIKGGIVLEEDLSRGTKTILKRNGAHTTIKNAAPRDYPTSHAALAATAYFDEDSRNLREKMFDCVF